MVKQITKGERKLLTLDVDIATLKKMIEDKEKTDAEEEKAKSKYVNVKVSK